MPPVQYHTQVIDHLGLVAGMCKELGIVEHIDQRAPKQSDEWHVSHGECIVAMILNFGFGVRWAIPIYVSAAYRQQPPRQIDQIGSRT